MPALGPIISSLVGNSPLAATSRFSMKCLAESSSAFPHLRGILVVRHANYVTHYTLISGKIEISNLFDFVTRRISVFRQNSRHGAQDPTCPKSVRIMRCGWTIVVIDQYTCTFLACVLKRNYLLAAALALGDWIADGQQNGTSGLLGYDRTRGRCCYRGPHIAGRLRRGGIGDER